MRGDGCTCIVRMSKRPRKTLTEMMSPKMVQYMSADVPLNHCTIGLKSGRSWDAATTPSAARPPSAALALQSTVTIPSIILHYYTSVIMLLSALHSSPTKGSFLIHLTAAMEVGFGDEPQAWG